MRFAARFGLVFALGSSTLVAAAADWPGFRGAHGGFALDTNLPAELTAGNIVWKVKLPGLGASSPIITGDKIVVTCYAGYGAAISKGMGGFGKGGFGKGGFGKEGKDGADAAEQKQLRLLVVCLGRSKGDVLWKKEIEPKLPEARFGMFVSEHGYASSTPVTDGRAVYVFFGKSGVFAFDLDGNQLWHADVGSKTDGWGSAASPVLHDDLVIVNAAIESGALVALDKHSGKERWRVPGMTKNWTSPVLVETKQGKHEVVLSLPGKIVGYDPATGKELWHCEGIGKAGGMGYTISTPVAKDGVVYVIGGGGPSGPATALAIRAGGRGDVTNSHLLWRQKAGSSICSPVLAGEFLCWVAGTATCLKADDGTIAYQERLYDARGEYVSAVAADNKIFALTRFDGLFVLEAGGKFEKLGHLDFAGDTSVFNASPAVSAGRLYIRSNQYLYCLGKK
jgi:outer membrane protein assembly factor BamB